MSQAVLAIFLREEDCTRAVEKLREIGVEPSDIAVIHQSSRIVSTSQDSEGLPEELFTGILSGAILGGLIGWILSLGVFDLHGIGRFAASHAWGAVISGTFLGAALLGLLSAVAFIYSRPRSSSYDEIRESLITVKSSSVPSEQLITLLKSIGAENVHPIEWDFESGQGLFRSSQIEIGSPVWSSDSRNIGVVESKYQNKFVVRTQNNEFELDLNNVIGVDSRGIHINLPSIVFASSPSEHESR